MEAGKGRRAKKCLEMRVGKSERAREGGGRRETAGMGQADRAGEEKFNLETQSSKLPKEVHAPSIHRRARRARPRGREAEQSGPGSITNNYPGQCNNNPVGRDLTGQIDPIRGHNNNVQLTTWLQSLTGIPHTS